MLLPNISLLPHDVHIWRVDLQKHLSDIEKLQACLSSEEMDQARRFVQIQHQQKFILSHAILRSILSFYLKKEAASLKFYRGPFGKPYLEQAENDNALYFNLSHSENLMVCAFTWDGEIGIDVEYQKEIEFEALAQRFFAPGEYQQLLSLPESLRKQGFYRCWTRKEAFIKALGKGFHCPLKSFEVDLLAESGNCLLEVDDNEIKKDLNWGVYPIFEASEYVAALATERKFRNLSLFEY